MSQRKARKLLQRKNRQHARYLEFLESRLLLTTTGALEVWAGNTNLSGNSADLFSIDQNGYTQLGATNSPNSSIVFSTSGVQYSYFVVVSRAQVQIDSMEGSDATFLTSVDSSGNFSMNDNSVTVGTQENDQGTYAGYAEFANPNNWTSLTIQTGAMGVMVQGQISTQADYLPGNANAYDYEGEVGIADNGLITSGEVRNPAGVWYPLTLNSDSDNSDSQWRFKNNFSSLANLNAALPDGTYTFVVTSPLGTTTTQFSYARPPLTAVLTPTGLTDGATGVSTTPTINWNASNDLNLNDNIELEIDGPNNENNTAVDDQLDISATSDGPLSLEASSNYSLELRLNSFAQSTNGDGFNFNEQVGNETDLLFRTAGTAGGAPDLSLTAVGIPDGTFHPGDWLELPITGGNTGGNAIGKSGGVTVPVDYQVVLAKTPTWGAVGNIVVGTGTIGTGSGGGSIGGESFSGNGGPIVQIPRSVTPGTYYIGIRGDSTGVLSGNTSTNSTAFSTTQITISASGSITLTAANSQTTSAGEDHLFDLGNFAGSGTTAPFAIDVNWGDGSDDTVFAMDAAGTIPATDHTYASKGHDTVTVTVTDWNGEASKSVTSGVTVNAVPTQLAFVPQPSNGTIGTLTPVVVQIQDADGNVVTTDEADVTVSLDSGPGDLTGTLTVAAVNGVATFSGLDVDAAGTLTLAAADSTDSLDDIVSDPFVVSLTPMNFAPHSVAGDVITIFAISGTNGSQPPQAARVTLQANGHMSELGLIDGQISTTSTYNYIATGDTTATVTVVQPDHTSTVILTFTSPDSGTYSTTIPAASETQTGYFFLQAPPFAQMAPATLSQGTLAFDVAGGGGSYQTSGSDDAMLNANGTIDNSSTVGSDEGKYTYKQTVGSTPGIARLAVNDTNGNPASFVSLFYTSASGGYYYRTDATVANGDSTHNDFQYGSFTASFPTTHLAFVQQPISTVAGHTISYQGAVDPSLLVEVLDSQGNLVTGDTSTVTIGLVNSNRTISGALTAQVIGGVATFNIAVDNAGSYIVEATDGGLTPAISKSFSITPDLTTSQIQFAAQPGSITLVGKALAPNIVVKAVDQYDNIIADHSKIILSTTGGTFTGSSTVTLSNGLATFPNIVFKTAGTYPMIATPATTSTLAITSPIWFLEEISAATTNVIPTPTLKAAGYTFGAVIPFAVTLTSNAPATIPFTGTPTLVINGTDSIPATTFSAAGAAKFTVPILDAGSYSAQIDYAGDGNHGSSSSALFTLTIHTASTTTTLAALTSTLVFGQTLTLTASVKSTGAPGIARTGSVEFTDNGNPVQTIALNSSSSASISFVPSATGSHNFQAVYLGSTDFGGSTSAVLKKAVGLDKTSAVLTPSPASPIPHNQTFNLDVQVSVISPGAAVLTGDMVTIKDNGKALTTVALGSNGHVTVPGLVYTASGTHSLTVIFAGDGEALAATSAAVRLISS